METEITYKTTKEECQESINKRMPIVCCSCGGKIEPIETVDNGGSHTFWTGCLACQCFDNGTKPEVYSIAVKMVEERHFRPYEMNEPSKKSNQYNYWRGSQIKGTVSLVEQILWLSKNQNS